MKLRRLTLANIGGLPDLSLSLPDHNVIALAGVNGTGKSRFLAGLLVPWTQALPSARNPADVATVEIELSFDSTEQDALEKLDRDAGWNQGRVPAVVTLRYDQRPIIGLQLTPQPNVLVLRNCFTMPEMLKQHPSFNLVYLPAERRLVRTGSQTVDLSQLAEDLGLAELAKARNIAPSAGQLDDQEFESYARALCIAGFLPGEDDQSASRWDEFKGAVDSILEPKKLLDLTRENPAEIRIGLPDGTSHDVQGLSSGERQALIIVSRVFRAGDGHSLVAIDEPDAFLHPQLAGRLLTSLTQGLAGGRLIVATHSPAILDSISPDAIVRFSHGGNPAAAITEEDRLALYREAGFRASAITQADRLIITEGAFDAFVLPRFIPSLSSASVTQAGGRDLVLRSLSTLSKFDIPIGGVVDGDVNRDDLPCELAAFCHVWPAADIEGVMLSDSGFLSAAIEGGLVTPEYSSLPKLQDFLSALLVRQKESVVAEYAQMHLRREVQIRWPSPRGDDALGRLLAMVEQWPSLTQETVEEAIAVAERAWEEAAPGDLWTLVRGKRVMPEFIRTATVVRGADAFVAAVSAREPNVAAFAEFEGQLPAPR